MAVQMTVLARRVRVAVSNPAAPGKLPAARRRLPEPDTRTPARVQSPGPAAAAAIMSVCSGARAGVTPGH